MLQQKLGYPARREDYSRNVRAKRAAPGAVIASDPGDVVQAEPRWARTASPRSDPGDVVQAGLAGADAGVLGGGALAAVHGDVVPLDRAGVDLARAADALGRVGDHLPEIGRAHV